MSEKKTEDLVNVRLRWVSKELAGLVYAAACGEGGAVPILKDWLEERGKEGQDQLNVVRLMAAEWWLSENLDDAKKEKLARLAQRGDALKLKTFATGLSITNQMLAGLLPPNGFMANCLRWVCNEILKAEPLLAICRNCDGTGMAGWSSVDHCGFCGGTGYDTP